MAEYETPAVEEAPRRLPNVRRRPSRVAAAAGSGVKRAVISNADDDVTELCTHMAFAHEMNIIVTSAIIGYEKPDARTYRAAFEPLGVSPRTRCASAINRNPTLPARCRSACVPP